MTVLTWDAATKRFYETGVQQGVLYVQSGTGTYPAGVAWNGLISVNESPSGAEPTPLYADNIKYLTLMSAEELSVTIEAYTFPDEFMECDGSLESVDGVFVNQQTRKRFGLAFKTLIGNDVDGQDHGYKLHLLYGCLASPSEKAYATINDSPEAITFSWEVSTDPVAVADVGEASFKPTSLLIIDSRSANAAKLALLEDELFGDEGGDPNLPLPNAVITLMTAT